MPPASFPFIPNPSKTEVKPPPGAVDAHCHVFGRKQISLAPERNNALAMRRRKSCARCTTFSFDKNVIVQASCHARTTAKVGTPLSGETVRRRGIAFVDDEVSDSELVSNT